MGTYNIPIKAVLTRGYIDSVSFYIVTEWAWLRLNNILRNAIDKL